MNASCKKTHQSKNSISRPTIESYIPDKSNIQPFFKVPPQVNVKIVNQNICTGALETHLSMSH